MDDLIKNFTNSLQTGYIDKSILSNIDYQPELLVNQKSPPKKVLSTILQEFENCNQFFISVAFVTTSGVAVIINKLKELEDRGIKGKILDSAGIEYNI
jgi:HKD family nuclease